MITKYLELIVAVSLISFASCNEDNSTTPSDNFKIKENSINHLNFDISASSSWLVHTENIYFTSDSILVTIKIKNIKEGSGNGDVHLYSGKNTTFAAYYFIKDTLINDTLLTDTFIYKAPDKATITFRNFSGSFQFEMDGL